MDKQKSESLSVVSDDPDLNLETGLGNRLHFDGTAIEWIDPENKRWPMRFPRGRCSLRKVRKIWDDFEDRNIREACEVYDAPFVGE